MSRHFTRHGDGTTVLIADGADPDTAHFSASGASDWPIADRDAGWSSGDADGRLREWAGVDGDDPSAAAWGKYASVHFWVDETAKDKLGSYKLPFCDVTDGKVTAVPKAVFGAAAAIQGSRGGVDLPSGDVDGVKSRIAGYYARMAKQFDDKDIKVPWTVRTRSELDPALELHHLDGCEDDTCAEGCPLVALVASAFAAAGGTDALAASRARRGLTAAVQADGTVVPGEWHSYLCVEGVRTDDGRELCPGSCRYPDLPISQRLLIEDEGGHWGAVSCGRTDTIEPVMVDGRRLHYAEGVFGSDPNGQLAELMVEEQTQRFQSIDPRDVTGEVIEVATWVDGEASYDCWWRITDCVIGASTIVAIPAFPQAVIAPRNVPLPATPVADASAPAGLPDQGPNTDEVPVVVIALPADDDDDDDDDIVIALPDMGSIGCGCCQECVPSCDGSCCAMCQMPASAVAASGATVLSSVPDTYPRPPREWFEDPAFHDDDGRLVLQDDDSSLACPLTVLEPDPRHGGLRRVYAHVAWWNAEHTGFPGDRIHPPASSNGYAAYLTGPGVELDDGTFLQGVGNVTMGCGHAPISKQVAGRTVAVPWTEAVAHYDGGYGAVQVFTVRAGQDAYGPWIAGYVRPDVTDAQLAEALTLAPSGDWRDIGGNLEMCAVLLVPVPGFVVRRALAASGAPEVLDGDFRAGTKDGRVYALVAAGRVQPRTLDDRVAILERQNRELAARLDDVLAASARRRFGL